jgi:hypothetical protein
MTMMTTIELTDEDALAFVEYRKKQKLFEDLLKAGVFDIRGGNAVLHFDGIGNLIKVEKNIFVLFR